MGYTGSNECFKAFTKSFRDTTDQDKDGLVNGLQYLDAVSVSSGV